MKKIFFLLASFMILISCDDDEPELYTGIFIDIVGKWEIVSEARKYYVDNVLIDDYVKYEFPFFRDPDTVYLAYLNFKNIGSVSWDTDDGFELHYGFIWGVDDNKFWYSEDIALGEENTEVTLLTDSEFHFIYTRITDNKFISWNGQREILSYKLKREL